MNTVFVGLGTNIEPRSKHMKHALQALAEHPDISVIQQSSIYETTPVGYADQADFLNMVVEIHTPLTALEVLDFCQQIEQQLGRKRVIRYGPRTIDLDILLYNQENSKMDRDRLIIPHPRMHERAFVLIPLNEIDPYVNIPPWNKRVVDFINELPETDIKDVRKWTPND